MNPIQNTEDKYIPMDVFILNKAKINPYDCHCSIDEAKDKQLAGWERAEGYREELEAIYYGDISGTDTRIISEGDDFNLSISREFAQQWKPANQGSLTEKPLNTPLGMAVPFGLLAEQIIQTGCISLPLTEGGQHEYARQSRLVELIQNLADDKGLSKRNLSSQTINRHIKNARDRVKENY